jgi:hypothetical protein
MHLLGSWSSLKGSEFWDLLPDERIDVETDAAARSKASALRSVLCDLASLIVDTERRLNSDPEVDQTILGKRAEGAKDIKSESGLPEYLSQGYGASKGLS